MSVSPLSDIVKVKLLYFPGVVSVSALPDNYIIMKVKLFYSFSISSQCYNESETVGYNESETVVFPHVSSQ